MNTVQYETCQQLTWNSCMEKRCLFCSDTLSYLLPIQNCSLLQIINIHTLQPTPSSVTFCNPLAKLLCAMWFFFSPILIFLSNLHKRWQFRRNIKQQIFISNIFISHPVAYHSFFSSPLFLSATKSVCTFTASTNLNKKERKNETYSHFLQGKYQCNFHL